MAYQVVWSQTAVDDLRQIVDFIAIHIPRTAAASGGCILPARRQTPELALSIRAVLKRPKRPCEKSSYGRHIIVYLVDNQRRHDVCESGTTPAACQISADPETAWDHHQRQQHSTVPLRGTVRPRPADLLAAACKEMDRLGYNGGVFRSFDGPDDDRDLRMTCDTARC